MTITSETKYRDFVPYEKVLEEGEVQHIKKAAEQFFKPCHTLTLNEFWGCLVGNFELLGDMSDPSVLQVYWIKRFVDFAEEFTKTCERLNVKDVETEILQNGCVPLSAQESTLVFVQEFFGLHSFMQAGEITIGEYILARKARFNAYKVRKNNEARQLQKLKKRKK